MPDARNFGDGLVPVEQPGGVWIVYTFDHGFKTDSIHLTELEALRVVERRGYGNVARVPFGVEIDDAVSRA